MCNIHIANDVHYSSPLMLQNFIALGCLSSLNRHAIVSGQFAASGDTSLIVKT